MQYQILKKDDLCCFIDGLVRVRKVVAPVAKDGTHFSFEEVHNGREVAMDYIPTILPPKKYFMPQHETLLEYDISEGQKMDAVVELEDIVLFAVHTCDIAGIQCLNTVFSDRPKDLNYLLKKERIAIIGLECNHYCDEYASCALMNNELPNGGYDLFFTDIGDEYIVHVNTYMGEILVHSADCFEKAGDQHLEKLEKLRKGKREIFKEEVNIDLARIPEMFDKSLKSGIWDEIGERCLSCGNCTNVCPTCYCFDVIDEPDLGLKSGKRIRVWDSCQNERFAKIAGGESFREKRSSRKKHRFYRKFRYPVDRYTKFFCTGCGRCSRTCMAKINLKETLAQLVREHG